MVLTTTSCEYSGAATQSPLLYEFYYIEGSGALKLEKKYTEDHQVTLTIEVEDETFERAQRRAARDIARKTKIPGFRPGKAPYDVVARQVGEAAIIEKAIDILIDEIYPKALDEAEVEPAAPGKLEDIVNLKPLKLVFTVPLVPEVTLGDYKSLRLPYEYEEITDAEVDEFIEMLRQRQATVITVDRPAQDGDMVHITLNAERLDAAEGEEKALLTDRHVPVLVEPEDADTKHEWPFPGFSRLVVGMSTGEEKEVEHEFPEDFESEMFQGVKARFHIKVEKVTERELPELDDEFAQSVGDFETMDDLRAEVRTMLEESKRAEYDKEYANQALDALVEQSEIKYPPVALERELEELREDFTSNLAQQGISLETYLKIKEQNEEEFNAELRDAAEYRVRRSLVVYQLAEEEKIEPSEEEVQNGTLAVLDTLANRMPEKEFRKLLKNRQAINELVSSVMMDLVTDKATARLSEIAQGKAEEPQSETETAEEAAPEEAPSEEESTSEEAAPAAEEETTAEE
ncbi:MAG: trigger factor [Anaerolineae bacterium]|nr:MAG: trigger factor [Anaerolineae bacterium]